MESSNNILQALRDVVISAFVDYWQAKGGALTVIAVLFGWFERQRELVRLPIHDRTRSNKANIAAVKQALIVGAVGIAICLFSASIKKISDEMAVSAELRRENAALKSSSPAEILRVEAQGRVLPNNGDPFHELRIELTNLSRGYDMLRVRRISLLCNSEEIGFYDPEMFVGGRIAIAQGANWVNRDVRLTNSKEENRGVGWGSCKKKKFIEVTSTRGAKFKALLVVK